MTHAIGLWQASRPLSLAASDAERLGLVEGQWVEVYNDRGKFQSRVTLTGRSPAWGGRRHRDSLEQAQPRSDERQ